MNDSDRAAAAQERKKGKDAVLRDRGKAGELGEGKAGAVPPDGKIPDGEIPDGQIPDGEIIAELGDEVGGPA